MTNPGGYIRAVGIFPLVAAVASTAFGIKITGAFHEDGLADTCDGLGATQQLAELAIYAGFAISL